MANYISLAEAASLLGVSKETLRNWDKSGRLKPIRAPGNNYRTYALADVQTLLAEQPKAAYHRTGSLFEDLADLQSAGSPRGRDDQERDAKRALARLHKALRDTDGNSSIIERFDEVTKLVFMKLLAERQKDDSFKQRDHESISVYSTRLREFFSRAVESKTAFFPSRFSALKLSDSALCAAGSILAAVELSAANQDLKGYAYEEMIRNTFDKDDNQQFFTPQPIVEFLVSLMGGRLQGRICDPACGTGGFLVDIVKRAHRYDELVGFEIDERLAWVTSTNLLVHGAERFRVENLGNGGTLGKAGERFFDSFDAVITNPPFGSDFAEQAELAKYVLGKGKTSRRRGVVFIERCLELLKTGGWLGIVIDEGVLTLPSASDVRELITQRAEIAAVISLPDTAFMPYASVNASILLMQKRTEKHAEISTFFGRAENVGRKANGDLDLLYDEGGSARLNSDLPEILEAWRHFETNRVLPSDTKSTFVVKLHRSALDQFAVGRLDFQFHHPARYASQAALEACELPLLPLHEICSVRSESYVPSVDFADQVIPFTGLAHIESKTGQMYQTLTPANALTSGVRRYERGDVLFARMRPNLRKAAYVDFEAPGYASGECVVLTVKEVNGAQIIDPFLLAILLRSDYVYGQIVHHIAGIGRPRITIKDLLNVRVPVPSAKDQAELKAGFLSHRAKYDALRSKARELTTLAAASEMQAIEHVANGFIGKLKKSGRRQ